ncbi:DUF2235 domain-containing protein [Microtetraspora fusca]|uniref:DUF2235 domain-containing protein n=1 Tax=Microtetraspora fusca TaxID=1997 RepID=UPI00082A91AD|nr:DUF2235 domain-containing protein [Microtetraspora fusca]
MTHLIVCCDGTWNTPEMESVTNVRRLYNALNEKDLNGDRQLAYYQPGVGTLRNRLLGGAFGLGLSDNVMDAYLWLTMRYSPGDRISLFGFSRGAYTARSLAGMISACGLIDTTKMDEAKLWPQIKEIYNRGYRQRKHDPHGREWRNGLTFRWAPDNFEQIPIHFIGVWETVGALGIPAYMGWLSLLDPLHRYDFHDMRLNPYIKHGRHAVAMDERRSPYTPALWSEPYGPAQVVKQVWFAGSHVDVGGGHSQRGLSDCALLWMIDEAREAVGIGFYKSTVEDQIKPDPLDVLHDDDHGAFGVLEPLIEPQFEPVREIFLQPRPRAVPRIDPDAMTPLIHQSVYDRYLNPPITSGPYRPTQVLAPGQSRTVEVFAHEPWNETGLYLEAGDYRFTAEGQWRDAGILSGPAGTTGLGRFNPLVEKLRLVGTLLGQGEELFRLVTRNRVADFIGARREEDLPWMSLVGVVANDAISVDGEYKVHERIAVGAGTSCRVTRSGYLYAFANDAWGFYGNNQGSVHLTVTRVPVEEQRTVSARAKREGNRQQAPQRGNEEVTGVVAPRRGAVPSGTRRTELADARRGRRAGQQE